MAINPPLNDGESFVQGRSESKARELIEAAEKAGIDPSKVVTTSHGYIVPSEIAGDDATTGADRPAVPTEPGTTTDPDEATNVGGLSQDADRQTEEANEAAKRQASPEPDEAQESAPVVPEDSDPERGIRTANDARREADEAPAADEGAEEEADDGKFDPSDHTVDEVWEYLEDADDAERQRVLDAEKAGKNRKAFQSETEGDK